MSHKVISNLIFTFLLVLPCAAAMAQNNAATGEPAVEYASGVSAPTEDSPITASRGTIADTDGIATFTATWQWGAADSAAGNYTDITSATAAAFTPGDDQVGKFLQVCASFTDDADNDEQRCLQIATAVANVNDPPTGMPRMRLVPETASEGTTTNITTSPPSARATTSRQPSPASAAT